MIVPKAPGEEFEVGDMIGLNADGQAVNLTARRIISKRLEAAPIKPHEGGYVMGKPFFMDCFAGAIGGIMEKLWVDAANDALAPPSGPIDYSIGIASIAEPDADTPHIVNG